MKFKSLTTRVILILIILLTIGITTLTFFNLSREQTQQINVASESTALLLNTIDNSIYNSMRIGNTESVKTILDIVGQDRRLLGVRIFHPHGIILKSSLHDEIGQPVNIETYQLFANNQKEGIFKIVGHGEVLKMIKPIYNAEPCFICHGQKNKIIGILSIDYSLLETHNRIVEATKLYIISTVIIIFFLSVTIWLVMIKFVRKPLKKLSEKMTAVEHGDLSTRMKANGNDEIGKLIINFDSMVGQLDSAKQELEKFHFQQMERADRLASVGEMAAGIAHEIKNPLTGIAAAITILKDDFLPEDPRTEIVNEVLEQIKRLDKTINDLLFFGKPTQPEPTYTNINRLLEKTLRFASQHLDGKDIENRLELQENLPPLYVDPKQIQQVFLNLILNAVQAMSDGGVLTITSSLLKKDGVDWIRICIIDTGSGIPSPILDKIFTPFFTTKAQGTGLGLAICHQLITQHNGKFSVTSNNGNGTLINLELPVYGNF